MAEKRATPPMGEAASTGMGAFRNYTIYPYNPDDLVRAKGTGLRVYQKMMSEPYIKAALAQKKTRLLNIGWEVLPASKDPLDMEIAEFVRWNLGTFLKGSFSRDVYEMCDALNNGFSVMEKIYATVPSGRWRGKVALKMIKSKDPYYFDFETDRYGNLGPRGLVLNALSGRKKKLNTGKFIIFSYNKTYENYYGSSDLRAAYRAFWIKDTAWKLRCVYMERYSGNNLLGKYPSNNPEAKNKLLEIFRTWQQETGMAIPEGMEVEVLKLATSAVSEYERSIKDCDREMQIGILGQTLTMDVGARGTGSRALGQVHENVLDHTIYFLDEDTATEVNEQVVRPLVDYNYDTDRYPDWCFKSRERFDGEAFSRTLLNLGKLDLNIPKKFVKERYRIPEPEEGEEVITVVETAAQPAPAPVRMAEKTAPAARPDKYHRPLGRFEVLSELPRVEEETASLIDAALNASTPIYAGIRDSIARQVRRRGVFEGDGKDFEAIEKIAVDSRAGGISALKKLFADTLLKAALMGRGDINKLAGQRPVRMAEDYIPDAALEALAVKAGMTKASFESLTAEMKGRAFTVAGLEKATIEKEVKTLLLQTIKSGDDFKTFNFRLNEMFIKYSMPVYGTVGAAGGAILDFHAETVFRTNVMDAYNQGRKSALEEPDTKEAFPAWEYSAILDGRTRPTHAAMDGKVFMADDPVWSRITPPAGYNCRCVLIPINSFDFTRDMLSSSADIPAGFPDPGFG